MSFHTVSTNNSFDENLYPLREVSSEADLQEHFSASFDSKEIEEVPSEQPTKDFLTTTSHEIREALQGGSNEPHHIVLQEEPKRSFSQRKVISDDFPPFTPFGRYLGSIYKGARDQWASYFSPKLELPSKISVNELLPQKEGFTGLSNHHGTCYLNTTLQILTVALTIVFERGTSEEQERVAKALVTHMPSLLNLMNGELRSEGALQQLYREVAHELASDLWYSWNSQQGIGTGQLETGYKRSGDPIRYLSVLLHQLGVEPLYLKYTQKGKTEYHSRQHLPPSCFLSLRHQGALPSPDISPLLEASLRRAQPPSSQKSRSLQGVIDHGFQKEGCQLTEPFPAILGIEVTGYGLTIEDNLSFHGESESPVIYEVAAITMAPPQHAFSLIRKNNKWYEVNDHMIFSIPKEWEEALSDYLQKYASFVLFKKTEAPPAKKEAALEKEEESSLQTNALAQVQEVFQYWPETLVSVENFRKGIESMSTYSFFLKQVALGLKNNEITLESDFLEK